MKGGRKGGVDLKREQKRNPRSHRRSPARVDTKIGFRLAKSLLRALMTRREGKKVAFTRALQNFDCLSLGEFIPPPPLPPLFFPVISIHIEVETLGIL